MILTDKDALICDLAETYGVYDMQSLPADLVGSFCYGLRDSSRIKMILQKQKVPTDTILLASIVDRLSYLVWFKTEDARHGRNRPECLVDKLLELSIDREVLTFDSAEEFETRLAELKAK